MFWRSKSNQPGNTSASLTSRKNISSWTFTAFGHEQITRSSTPSGVRNHNDKTELWDRQVHSFHKLKEEAEAGRLHRMILSMRGWQTKESKEVVDGLIVNTCPQFFYGVTFIEQNKSSCGGRKRHSSFERISLLTLYALQRRPKLHSIPFPFRFYFYCK